MHGWVDKSYRGFDSHQFQRKDEKSHRFQVQILKSLYRPARYSFENPESYYFPEINISDDSCQKLYSKISNNYPLGIEQWKLHLISSNFSMWDSISRSYKIFEQYDKDLGKNFDLIIRCRYDVLPMFNLEKILREHNFNAISVPSNNMPTEMYCDWFAIGTPLLMKNYFNLFSELPSTMQEVIERHGAWCNEYGLYHHLKNKNVMVRELNMDMKFN